jgi:hypothetical protein
MEQSVYSTTSTPTRSSHRFPFLRATWNKLKAKSQTSKLAVRDAGSSAVTLLLYIYTMQFYLPFFTEPLRRFDTLCSGCAFLTINLFRMFHIRQTTAGQVVLFPWACAPRWSHNRRG